MPALQLINSNKSTTITKSSSNGLYFLHRRNTLVLAFDEAIFLFDGALTHGTQATTLRLGCHRIGDMAVSPCESSLVCAGGDCWGSSMYVLDMETMQIHHQGWSFDDTVTRIAYAHTGETPHGVQVVLTHGTQRDTFTS